MVLKELAVILALDPKEFTQGAGLAGDALEAFGSQASKVGNIVSASFDVIKKAVLGISGALAASVFEASRFEDAMFKAWKQAADGADASGAKFESFKQAAFDVAKGTMFSAVQIAQGMNTIADRARNVAQTMEEVAWASKLAQAEGVDLTTSSDAVSRAMMIFGKQGLTAAQAANYLMVAGEKGALGIDDLGMAFRTLFPMAAAMGWSLKDMLSVLATLSTKGIEGGRAVFALSGILDAAVDPTKGLGKSLAEAGIAVVNASGDVMPLLDIIEKLQGLGWTTQQVYQKFGTNMGTIFATISEMGPSAFTDMSRAMEESTNLIDGLTNVERQAEERTKTLGGAFGILWASTKSAGAEIGESFAKALIPNIKIFADWIQSIGEAIASSGVLKTSIEVLGAALVPVRQFIGILIEKFKEWGKTVNADTIVEFAIKVANALQNMVQGVKQFIYEFRSGLFELQKFMVSFHLPFMGSEASKAGFKTPEAYLTSRGINQPQAPEPITKTWGQTIRENLSTVRAEEEIGKPLIGVSEAAMGKQLKVPDYGEQLQKLTNFFNQLQVTLTEQMQAQGQLTDVMVGMFGSVTSITATTVEDLKAQLQTKFEEFKAAMQKPKEARSLF
jgi:TP901 family phage tail tape measure protein